MSIPLSTSSLTVCAGRCLLAAIVSVNVAVCVLLGIADTNALLQSFLFRANVRCPPRDPLCACVEAELVGTAAEVDDELG